MAGIDPRNIALSLHTLVTLVTPGHFYSVLPNI